MSSPNFATSRHLGTDLSSLGDDPPAEIAIFAGATDSSELDRRLRQEVKKEVGAILEAIEDADAFDVIELMRMRALPLSPELALMSGFDGSAAAIELISLVLLTRGGRHPSATPREHSRPHEKIDDLHDRAKRLIRLASYRSFAAAQLNDRSALARVAAEYQSYFVGVRSHQYRSLQTAHDVALFDRADSDALLMAHLGFTYRDFLATREAMLDLCSKRLMDRRDRIGDLLPRTAEDRDALTPDEKASLREDTIVMMFLPGPRAIFTANDLAAIGDVEEEQANAVLSRFASDFDDSKDPVDVVMAFLRGANGLNPRCLVRSGSDHVMTSTPIGDDSFRSVAEAALKADSKAWHQYDQKIRKQVSEGLAVEAIEAILRTKPAAAPIFYVAPKEDQDESTVDQRCSNPSTAGDLVEGDALFVIDDVAICVEVKGRSVAEPARRGDLKRFEREARNILGSGAGQARRLESLIRTNGGVWRSDGAWFDLSGVREIHTIVIGLDTFGPLGVTLGDLASASVLGEGRVPWITSLHDLDVIAGVLDRPAEFLLYLRRRTGPEIAEHFRGCDELDLFMLFVDGGLFVEPDPDEIHRTHTRSSRPTRDARRRHRDEARPTIVGTYTDDLDAWMYSLEGGSHLDAPKPRFNSHRAGDEIVNLLQEEQVPGWLRLGSDILALSGEAQVQLGASISQIAAMTRTDGQFHKAFLPYPGNEGFPVFFVACSPPELAIEDAMQHLETYMRAKKHQLQADRCMGLLLDHECTVIAGIYMNNPPTADEELDELGRRIGLQRTWNSPPRAKPANKARRQRKKAKKRKRR